MSRLAACILVLLCLGACTDSYRAGMAAAQYEHVLDRLRERGHPVRLVVELDRPAQDTLADARKRDQLSTILVLSQSEARVGVGPRLRAQWNPELSQRLQRDWVLPYLRAKDYDGAARGLARGFVEVAAEKTGLNLGWPLPPILGPNPRASQSLTRALAWGLPFSVALLAFYLWRTRREATIPWAELGERFLRAFRGSSTGRYEGALPRPALLLLLVLTVVAVVYSPSLSVPFLWDDRRLIVEEIVETTRPVLDYVLSPFWRAGETGLAYRGFFRPLTTLSFVFDAYWSGGNPVGFHLTNLLAHLMVVAALFAVARRLGSRPVPALLASLCFGLAPRLTESVTWVSGRTDVLAALFGLLALSVYPLRVLEVQQGASWRKASAAAALVILGLLAKEIAVAFLLVFAVDELAYQRATPNLRDAVARAAPFAIGLGAYALLRAKGLSEATGETLIYGGPRALASLEAAGRYSVMLLDFARPLTQIGFLPLRSWPFVILGAVVSVLVLVACGRCAKRVLRPAQGTTSATAASLSLCLALFGLLPVLHIIPLSVNVVAADRFLYVPLIGIGLAVALAWSRLGPQYDARLGALGLALAIVSGFGTARRNEDYASEATFWVEAVRTTRPENTLPLNELANVYYRSHEHDLALHTYMRVARQLRRADTAEEVRARPLANMASAQSALGRYDEALRLSERILKLRPPVARDLHNLALLYLHLQDFERAQKYCQAALGLYANYDAARRTLDNLEDLERSKAELDRLSGQERALHAARHLARTGSRFEAQATYLQLLRDRVDPEVRDEAFGYLVLFGDAGALEEARTLHTTGDPALAAALQERQATAAEIAASRPLIAPYLARYDAEELGL